MDAKDELGSTSQGSFSGALGTRMMLTDLNFQGLVGSVLLGLLGWMLFDW
jgi:hypothetical protein